MKRTTLFASAILVALAACEDRTEAERESAVAVEREAQEVEIPEPVIDPLPEPREAEPEAERAEGEEQPVVGRTGSEAERQPTAGTTGALSHVPKGCKALLYAKMSDLRGLPGAEKHLRPAFDEVRTNNQNVQQIVTLLKDGGIDSAKDVEELALCLSDAPTAKQVQKGEQALRENTGVILSMTGGFEDGALVSALRERSGEKAEKIEIDGADVFRNGDKTMFVGQAKDGTVIAAQSRDDFSQALSGGGDYELSTDNALGLLMPENTMQSLLDQVEDPVAKKLAGDIERTMVTFDADEKKLALRVDMPDHTQAAEIGGVLKARQAQMQSQRPTDDVERRFANVMKDASVEYQDDVAILNVSVKDEQIEAVMQSLADQVRTFR